jgi:hypothetical protein
MRIISIRYGNTKALVRPTEGGFTGYTARRPAPLFSLLFHLYLADRQPVPPEKRRIYLLITMLNM